MPKIHALIVCLFEGLRQFQITFFGHISEVGPPNPLSWIGNQLSPNSLQVTNY